MLIQIECPKCGHFNEACMCGIPEVKGFECTECGSKLDIMAISANSLPEVYQSEDTYKEEEDYVS